MVRMKRQVVAGDSKEDEAVAAAGDGKDDKAGSGGRQQGE